MPNKLQTFYPPKQQANPSTRQSYFPARIQMIDTGEIFIAKSAEEIPPSSNFKIFALRVKEENNDQPK